MLQVEREDTEDIVSNGLEPSVYYYIAFFALQAFLILLKQSKYGTDAGENKCSLTIHCSLSAFMSNSNSPVWPPVALEPEKNI